MRITHVIRGSDHISNTPEGRRFCIARWAAAPPIFAPRSADSGTGPHASFQAPWRHQRWVVPRRRFSARSVSKFSGAAGLVHRRRRIYCEPRKSWERFSLEGRKPHQCRFRSAQAGMVLKHAVFAETSHRRTASRGPRRVGTRQAVATRMGRGEARVVFRKRWTCCVPPAPDCCPIFATWGRARFSAMPLKSIRRRARNFGRTSAWAQCWGKTVGCNCGAWPAWDHDSCDHALRELAAGEGVKAGLLINATRVAIVGQAVAPPLFETMLALGQDRVVSRPAQCCRNVRRTLNLSLIDVRIILG